MCMKKAFVSWSGGKDCMFALYKTLYNKLTNIEIACLLNFCSADGNTSSSHNMPSVYIKLQAQALRLPVIQPVCQNGYEEAFLKALTNFEKEGVRYGVFGDIYLEEHRSWIEERCKATGITPVFLLWGFETLSLYKELLDTGFKTVITGINRDKLPVRFLGRFLDIKMLDYFLFNEIDPCAENGEYHTFVVDGPLFYSGLDISFSGMNIEKGKMIFAGIENVIIKQKY